MSYPRAEQSTAEDEPPARMSLAERQAEIMFRREMADDPTRAERVNGGTARLSTRRRAD